MPNMLHYHDRGASDLRLARLFLHNESDLRLARLFLHNESDLRLARLFLNNKSASLAQIIVFFNIEQF